MRDALNLKMLPLVEENINGIDFNPMMRFISTNSYYGFHNPPHVHQKAKSEETDQTPMNTEDNHNYNGNIQCQEKMEINVSRLVSRKRAWEYGYSQQFPDFKKRRQDDHQNSFDTSRQQYQNNHVTAKDTYLLEELLRGTHGSNMYNWNTHDL